MRRFEKSYRVFSLSRIEKITLKPLNERRQENELLQKTHKYTTYPSLKSVRSTVF